MRSLYAIFIILLFTILFAGTLTAQYEYISQYMADNHIPGLAACKIVKDSVVWQGYYGYANLARSIPFTDSTSIELASISKTFVATALMQLYERGLFGLDDSINGHLPFRVVNPTWRDTAITFRMLLTHTSSIRDRFPVPPWGGPPGDPTIPLDTLLYHYLVPGGRYYSTQNFSTMRPGFPQSWSYSSWGATLLAYLVEVMSGVPFEQYTRDSITAPLQMTNTGWFYRDLDTSLVAHPYTYSGVYVDHYGGSYPIWPSGSLRTNLPSLARYLKMNMQNGHIGGRRILDSATVRLMRTANFERYDPEYGLEGWGLIWFRDTIGGKTLWGHTGSLPGGIRTAMFLSEEDSTGFIVLTNKYDHPWRTFLARFINTVHVPGVATYDVGVGWNLVSLGVSVADRSTRHLFPGAVSSAFGFDATAGYVAHDSLNFGAGYWLKFPSSDTITLIGSPVLIDTIEVTQGWNVIGSLTVPLLVGSIVQNPAGVVVSDFFGYSGTYTTTNTLLPGHGYWVKASGQGSLILSSPYARQAPPSGEVAGGLRKHDYQELRPAPALHPIQSDDMHRVPTPRR